MPLAKCEAVQPPWEMVRRFLKKSETAGRSHSNATRGSSPTDLDAGADTQLLAHVHSGGVASGARRPTWQAPARECGRRRRSPTRVSPEDTVWGAGSQ